MEKSGAQTAWLMRVDLVDAYKSSGGGRIYFCFEPAVFHSSNVVILAFYFYLFFLPFLFFIEWKTMPSVKTATMLQQKGFLKRAGCATRNFS